MFQKLLQAIMPAKKVVDLFTLQIEGNNSIENVIQKIEEECENHKFTILKTYDYYEILKSKGFPIKRKVYIYEICQARTASLMLTENPLFSVFMPCRLAIYEDAGRTVISTMDMGFIIKTVKSNHDLYKEATTLSDSLKALMDSLAGEDR